MFATFLIGLREGLEAALVVGILVAILVRSERRDVLPRLWIGVGLAIGAVARRRVHPHLRRLHPDLRGAGALGGILSILAVAMVTTMIFWMQGAARNLRGDLEHEMTRALATGGIWGVVAIGFISVAREGIETTLLLWSMVQSFGGAPSALLGAVAGWSRPPSSAG